MAKLTEKQNSIDKVLNGIDRDELGEIMMDKAESLQMEFGDNIIIFDITLKDLKKENFSNMEKMSTIEYGDWDSLKNWVSESEVRRIQKQFDEDLEDLSNDEDSEVDDCAWDKDAEFCDEDMGTDEGCMDSNEIMAPWESLNIIKKLFCKDFSLPYDEVDIISEREVTIEQLVDGNCGKMDDTVTYYEEGNSYYDEL